MGGGQAVELSGVLAVDGGGGDGCEVGGGDPAELCCGEAADLGGGDLGEVGCGQAAQLGRGEAADLGRDSAALQCSRTCVAYGGFCLNELSRAEPADLCGVQGRQAGVGHGPQLTVWLGAV